MRPRRGQSLDTHCQEQWRVPTFDVAPAWPLSLAAKPVTMTRRNEEVIQLSCVPDNKKEGVGERCPTSQWSGRLRAAHFSAAHRHVRRLKSQVSSVVQTFSRSNESATRRLPRSRATRAYSRAGRAQDLVCNHSLARVKSKGHRLAPIPIATTVDMHT